MQARPMPSCGIRLSVCLSRSYILSKRVTLSSKLFHRRVAKPRSIFFYTKRHGNIPTGSPPNGDVACRWGRKKSRSQHISGSITCCERFDCQGLYTQLRWIMASYTHIRLLGLNKRLTDRNLNNEIASIVVTAQSLINVTIKISANKISIKETCSTFWKQSIMFAWSEVVVFCSCGD